MRENLIEREQEVAGLRMTQLEGKERMSLLEEELDVLRTDLQERRAEELQIKCRLARYETTMRTEDVLIDNEINKQTSDITALTNETREIEVRIHSQRSTLCSCFVRYDVQYMYIIST